MTRSRLDRESFQNLLAGAFIVQHTLLHVASPSIIDALRHLIVTRQLALNVAMRLIAGCARNVANATGVAIGLLESNHLAYVAGSGSAAACVGRRMSAMLSMVSNIRDRVEILRVENAEKETRIEDAICRQFGVKALLILPIYRDRALAGIIEIMFKDAHVFQDGEICTYHLMAKVAGEALAYSGTFEPKAENSTKVATPSETMKQKVSGNESLPNKIKTVPNVSISYRAYGAGTEPEKLASGYASLVLPDSSLKRPTKLATPRLLWRSFADSAAVIIVLVTAGWIAYGSGHSASSLANSARATQEGHQHQELLLPARSQVTDRSKEQPEAIPTEAIIKSQRRTPRRVVIGNQEIVYVSEDVTVHHFIPKLAVKPAKGLVDSSTK